MRGAVAYKKKLHKALPGETPCVWPPSACVAMVQWPSVCTTAVCLAARITLPPSLCSLKHIPKHSPLMPSCKPLLIHTRPYSCADCVSCSHILVQPQRIHPHSRTAPHCNAALVNWL